MYQHLSERSYYEKMYDQQTIEECLDVEQIYKSEEQKGIKAKDKKLEVYAQAALPLMIEGLKLYRAGKRNEAVTEWMDRDKMQDEKISSTSLPSARCEKCGSASLEEMSRDLMSRKDGGEAVLFMFTCNACSKNQAVWEDGEQWKYEAKCDECKGHIKEDRVRKGDIISSSYKCNHCGHEGCDELDLAKGEKQEDQDEGEFEKLRAKYCASEKDGEEYLRSAESIGRLVDDFKEKDKNKAIYEAIEKLEKLKATDLENFITKIIKSCGYDKFNFLPPEIGKNVIIPFTVQDTKSDREEYDSRQELTKILRKELEKTNWRLMSDGITYRMGILQGRLRGYESDDLYQLISGKKKV